MSNDTDPKQPRPSDSEPQSTAPRKGPEVPRSPHDTSPDDLHQALRETTEQAEDLDTRVQALPEHQRLLAVFGITRPFQAGRLPEPYRAVSITVPRKHLGAMRALLQNLALPCSSDFLGDQSDSLVSLTYIVPDQDNVQHILSKARSSFIPAKIAVAQDATLFLRRERSPVVSIHSILNDHTSSLEEGRQTAVSISRKGRMQDISRPQELQSQTAFDTTHASAESYAHAKTSKISIPREGSCTYLMIDQNYLQEQRANDPHVRGLLNELRSIALSPDFYVTGYNGYLVIVALAERSGSLKGMAKRIFKSIPLSKMFVAKGDIRHHGPENFTIEGFPQTSARPAMTEFMGGVYIDPETTRHRDGSLDEVTTRPTSDPRWERMLEYRPKVSLRVGGPDKLVGYQTQYDELVKGITDEETKFMVVRGAAGMGKSRLIEEALSEDNVHSKIICSLDPSGKNIPGFGLMTIAEQIAEQLKRYAEESNRPETLNTPEAKALMGYTESSQIEKLETAQRNPAKVENCCLNALRLLNTGRTPLVIDDIHHADKHSIPYITSLADRYMSQNGKVILSMRPEEMYSPEAVNSLIARTQASSDVKEVSVEGLNFKKDFIAKEFVFHSLPKQIRETPEGTAKALGPWYKDLGRIAGKSPFVMKTLMDEILSDPLNLIIEGEVIILKPEVLERIKRIKSKSDLANYYTERLGRVPPNSRKFLQCLALMGGRATIRQVSSFSMQMLGVKDDRDFRALTAPLTAGEYIFLPPVAESGEEKTVQLQHETMCELVVGSLPPEEKLELSKNLYAIFRKDPSTHTDTKFSLMHTVASSPIAPELEEIIWGIGYGPLIDESLQDAKRRNAVGKAHSIAETVLGENGCPTVIRAVAALQNPRAKEVPDSIKKIAIKVLFAKAESAIYIGRFGEVTEVVEILEKIESLHRGTVDLQAAYLLLFESEYIQADESKADKMDKIYREKLQKGRALPPALKAIVEIKLAYRRGNFAEVDRIYDEALPLLEALNEQHKSSQTNVPKDQRSPHPDYMEASRLHNVRRPAETLRMSVRKKRTETKGEDEKPKTVIQLVDDDVLLQPGAVSREHMHSISEIMRALTEIDHERERNPLLFNGYSELSLRGETAMLAAFTGKYEQAIAVLAESFRLAEQMELHQRAARQAKLMGDIYAVQGISILRKTPSISENGETAPRGVFSRTLLLRAIEVYSNEGMIALAQVDKNDFYQAAIRIQRLRAIGLLCDSYKGQLATDQSTLEIKKIKGELEAHIKKAFKDFIHVNKMWGDKIKKLSELKTAAETADRVFQAAKTAFQAAESKGASTLQARATFDEKSEKKTVAENAYKAAHHEVSEISYYLNSYIGEIVETARALSIPIPKVILNTQASPFINPSVIELGERFADRIFDNGIGELPRKQRGMRTTKTFATRALAA